MLKTLALLPFLFVSIQTMACSCYLPENFDLYEYDNANAIIEVMIINKIEDKIIQDELEDDYTTFKIKITDVFKGDLSQDIKFLEIDKLDNCYWEPIENETYIFYLNFYSLKDIAVRINNGCFKHLKKDSTENFKFELKALHTLQKKQNSNFRIYVDMNQNDFLISGKFRNQQRSGKWKIYEPNYQNIQVRKRNKVIVLKYKKGNIIKFEYIKPKDEFIANAFTNRWRHYYKNQLRKNI
ncbi:hypothetical protein KMW28_26165 [Flammeovirga yaeyamensis]|uniref:Lipoprotein n=1 Tax=Flammeovirga yaeyamensis TaxID=367791 RepID=A0AAX1NE28_9BACT|nr:hypothetical protein [Flammeovirga yaeyamensis]MBB3699212.1 hypothetical protein [Flammeovirga yaeyamensis]NMF35524.1 hypothetical protein [Flammeovirga yaeyamensis]QWG04383.1 hypothetical protein KMW28_26165 [Flammeovirga yaeyamensis]